MRDALIYRKLGAVANLMLAKGPEHEVSKRWLFHTSSHFDRKFESAHNYTLTNHGAYTQISVGKEKFLWPAEASISTGLQILCETLTPTHPHQYLYGPTQINSDDVVLDIGACEGAFAALVTGRCKQVIAIEPSRSMCELISELFRIRKQPSPLIVNCLLGKQSSRAHFLDNATNPGASRVTLEPTENSYEVPVLTLDQLIEQIDLKPTFIKCDAEGAAPRIFSGSKNFLKHSRPKIASASYHTPSEYDEMHRLLSSLGYNILGKGFLFVHDELRVQMIHAW
jgi:FkbM family methyltransferase